MELEKQLESLEIKDTADKENFLSEIRKKISIIKYSLQIKEDKIKSMRQNLTGVLVKHKLMKQTVEKLEKIPEIIKEIIDKQEKARFDRAHFKTFADFSLNFEIVFWIIGADYNLYMDIQQSINLQIYRRFGEEAIEFAYPTQTLFIEKQ